MGGALTIPDYDDYEPDRLIVSDTDACNLTSPVLAQHSKVITRMQASNLRKCFSLITDSKALQPIWETGLPDSKEEKYTFGECICKLAENMYLRTFMESPNLGLENQLILYSRMKTKLEDALKEKSKNDPTFQNVLTVQIENACCETFTCNKVRFCETIINTLIDYGQKNQDK